MKLDGNLWFQSAKQEMLKKYIKTGAGVEKADLNKQNSD